MVGRPYEDHRDLAAVTRMWREVGWIDGSDAKAGGLRDFMACGHSLVADVDGEAECLVHRSPGSVRYDGIDLALGAITAVTTSHVGRRRGLATALMVEALCAAREEGAAVASLGIFDQGFYDRFGFGTGSYQNELRFDPATLRVAVPDRTPVRLGIEDHEEIHDLALRRHRGHGSVVLDPPGLLGAEMCWTDDLFGLGYRGDDGRLTHAVIGSLHGEHGPCTADLLLHEEARGVLDLLGLLRSLGDQVSTLVIRDEPAGIQIQDLIEVPFRQRRNVRHAGGNSAMHVAFAAQQDRILDLVTCIGAVRSPEPLRFGLRLRDPLAALAGAPSSGLWPGVSGEYTVHLDATSGIEDGVDPSLPALDATVNAFSRLWLGVRPATGLGLTDDLAGPDDLLHALDRVFRLPPPRAGMTY